MNAIVNRFADAESLAQAAAEQFVALLTQLTASKPVVNVMLTGGTIGIATLSAISRVPTVSQIDFSKVHFWWGDERFVEFDSPDRNALQARKALLGKIAVPEQNIHEFPHREPGVSLQQAAIRFETDLAELQPDFDFAFVGMGPDGHVCSLFPGHEVETNGAMGQAGLVIAESDSPKRPAERLSFSYAAMNSVDEIWFVVAGADKADAIADVFGDEVSNLPAAKIMGKSKTVWFIDQTAGVRCWGC